MLLTPTLDVIDVCRSVAVTLDVIRVVFDGTKALLVAKDAERMMQMMETIGNILVTENLFDRDRSSKFRGRLGQAIVPVR